MKRLQERNKLNKKSPANGPHHNTPDIREMTGKFKTFGSQNAKRSKIHINMKTSKQQLLELLKTNSFFKGNFKLASGQVSPYYINCKNTILTGKGHQLIGEVLSDYMNQNNLNYVQGVAGVVLGGCSLASSVSYKTGLDAYYIRKEPKHHGTESLIEGMSTKSANNILLLEDVVTTGKSSLFAISVLRDNYFRIKDMIVLVDREQGAKELLEKHDVKCHSIFTIKDFE